MKIVVAITGASGAILGIKLLEILKKKKIESHLIISRMAEITIKDEVGIDADHVRSMASHYYSPDQMDARLASGSFKHDGMVIIPCSMKTMAAIANGYSSELISRASDVTLKERRKLIIVPRETPMNVIHLRNMLTLAEAGAVILPPMPAFYQKPKNVDDIVSYVVGKVLDILDIPHNLFTRWNN
ncbi:MAG TPA: UbiX family flavin prenyltransferase [Candidatus Bathyarchaeia archaeon]|nr:UbiX family flavin prenyltransferase [Candidatus Bathyarchaeia archaeon]